MPQQSQPEKSWKYLQTETGMNDAQLQKRLEHFLGEQRETIALIQGAKTLAALELSRRFSARFRQRDKSLTDSIHYWTVTAENSTRMYMDGTRGLQETGSPFGSGLLGRLDLLKNCYVLYLNQRGEPLWPPASRKSNFVRNKWLSPDLQASYFPAICRNKTDGQYANIMFIILHETLRALADFRKILSLATTLQEFRRQSVSPSPPMRGGGS